MWHHIRAGQRDRRRDAMSDSLYDLSDQVAIITGGGTGIGEATAHLLAQAGAHTVLASRNFENLERVAKAVEAETGRRSLPAATDGRLGAPVPAPRQRPAHELGQLDRPVTN